MPTEIEHLYREHRAGLVRLVQRELHDHHDAEDVVQTAFVDAQRAIERGTIPRNPRAWLAAIALNAAHRLRRRRVNAEPLEEYAVHEASGMSEIRAALASLPREQRAAVLYRDLLGLSYGETAEQMGTSVNAVTMLLYRGRQRLRQTLGATAGGPWFWRWAKQAGLPQAAVVKGAAAVVAAAGLATAGVVSARAVAPVGSDRTSAPAPRPVRLMADGARATRVALTHDSARRHARLTDDSRTGVRAGATESSTPAPSTAATTVAAAPSTADGATRSLSVPIVGTLPATVGATVIVSTPVTTVTVTTRTVTVPTGTTVTVTTPITTVTVPIP